MHHETLTGNTMIFRLSQKLAKKLKTAATDTLPLDENPYADWSAHLFTAGRTQYILVTNTKSLYSVVMQGKGITNDGQFIERALNTIREFMEDDGQEFVYRKFIEPASDNVQFAKALNRSVTGSMNELIKFAELWLVEGVSPCDVGFKLNDTLMSALATKESPGYGKPCEAFKLLMDGCGSDKHGDVSCPMQSDDRTELTELQQIPNVGPAIADDLRLIGISSPQDLLGKDPYTMHDDLFHTTGIRHDLCELDVFISAVRFMDGEPKRPWWKYTAERKRELAAKTKGKA